MAPEIAILPDEKQLADAAAQQFISAGNAAIEARGTFAVALSGGSTPRSVYARLATEPFVSAIDWARIHFLWGDERCVPPEHEASNYRMARETLLAHVPVPEANVHRMRGEDDPEAAANDYEHVLRRLLRTPTGPRALSQHSGSTWYSSVWGPMGIPHHSFRAGRVCTPMTGSPRNLFPPCRCGE